MTTPVLNRFNLKTRWVAGLLVLLSTLTASESCARPTAGPTTQSDNPYTQKVFDYLASHGHGIDGLPGEDWAHDPLDKDQSRYLRGVLSKAFGEQVRRQDQACFADNEVKTAGATLKLLTKKFGAKPAAGWPLFISLHGGGNAPVALNDQQWHNQIKLYELDDAFFIAPRAPGNTWDLWHEPHIDPLLDRLITDAIVLGEVDPNRIYLMGYSAGGDGVYQLAPRMADRFAAASMMAGHPNSAQPDGLRNLPFAIHVGASDAGYGRNNVAADWKNKLDTLQAGDPGGYVHVVQIHPGRAHWMNGEDKVAVPWMASFTRERLPSRVVWRQGQVVHNRFYWLAVPDGTAKKNQLLIATFSGQKVVIEKDESVDTVTILLNDQMLDLDQPVGVFYGNKQLFHGLIRRTIAAEAQSLVDRGDPSDVFDATITVRVRPELPALQDSRASEVGRCVKYLQDNMPARDRLVLDDAFLRADATDSLRSRNRSPWAKQVPDEIFREYVLPYRVVDETRDDWRAELRPVAERIVFGIDSPGEAARKLNAKLYQQVHVKYDATRRPFPNESAAESIACGYASCTGLSILLIDACRSVDIPARLVGIASWAAPDGPTYNGGGNHSWVEIWDGRQWRFLGAAEPSELDHTWFIESATRSIHDSPAHAILASAFGAAPDHLVLAWAPADTTAPAINVTRFYTARTKVHVDAPASGRIEIWNQGRIAGAGAAGDFILGKGEQYGLRVFDSDGHKIAERTTDFEKEWSL